MSAATQHTPGPLRYDFEPGYCGELVASNGETVATFNDEPTEANARRLVACWNACDSIDTDLLESIPGITGPMVSYHELKAQRDDLLAALRVAEESVGDLRAMEIVRAAIAKVEGGSRHQ